MCSGSGARSGSILRTRRIRIALLIVFAGAVLLSALWLLARTEPDLSRAKFNVIQPGMTAQQVDAILGEPLAPAGSNLSPDFYWAGPGADLFLVRFDEQGIVTGTSIRRSSLLTQDAGTPWERARRSLARILTSPRPPPPGPPWWQMYFPQSPKQ